jgi:hypothetical protein
LRMSICQRSVGYARNARSRENGVMDQGRVVILSSWISLFIFTADLFK